MSKRRASEIWKEIKPYAVRDLVKPDNKKNSGIINNGLYFYDTGNVSSHQLSNITIGDYNTVYGFEAGNAISSSGNCTFIGSYAGEYAEGDGEIFIGKYAGNNLQYGSGNVALGWGAGQAYGVTGAGADDNIFIGTRAGYQIDGGYQNIFIGLEAGYTCADDNNNVFIGSYTGKDNNGGSENTFIGAYAGRRNTTADYNTLIGTWAGYYNQTGSNNTIVGYEAGNGVSGNSYSNNVFIGYRSGYSMTTGTANVFLGYQAGYSETGSNKLYIENSNSATPLIYGEFDNDLLQFNTLKMGFYGTAAIAQQVLATGAGASVDDVITALQALGLVKQS